MSNTTTQPATADIRAQANRISGLAAQLSEQIDAERRLPAELVAALSESGLLRGGAPREADGLELPVATSLACAEEIARGNAAVGWCVSIAVTSSLLVAYLPESSRDELFGNGRGVAAGVWAPRGKARTVDGGVVVSGQWPFCSGITHSDVLFGGAVIDDNPRPVILAMPTSELEILDTWHTLGLRGTGSHDTVAKELFVPDDRIFPLTDGPQIDRTLYRFPPFGFFAACIAAAAMGNARAAIDSFVELAGGKKSQGSSRTLAERPTVQAAVATAESSLEAARSLYYQAIEDAWAAADQEAQVPVDLRARVRLAATHGTRTAADVVRSMFDLAGGTAIYDSSPLQRQFRDAFTATAHFQVNEASRELPGRLLLGMPTDAGML